MVGPDLVSSVFIRNHQSPGDICMLTAAVRDLKAAYPGMRINVDTSARCLWDNNPYLDRTVSVRDADVVIDADYPLIHESNKVPYHFIHGFRKHLETRLGLPIPSGAAKLDIHLSLLEKAILNPAVPERYWIINAGHKDDFTAKMWEFSRYCEVVDRLQGVVTFVQIGSDEHQHKPIPGAINLIGKTPGRRLLPLMYRAAGVLTGVSYPMHLSMMDVCPELGIAMRPCVCIAGGREPLTWYNQPNMHAFHTSGLLPCCSSGGCWRSRVTPLNDGSPCDHSLCENPVVGASGQVIPKCMQVISVDSVVDRIKSLENICVIAKEKPTMA